LAGAPLLAPFGGGENRKLDAGLLAGALGAGYFLLLIDDNLLEAGFCTLHRGIRKWAWQLSLDPATSAADLIIAGVAAFADSLPRP